MIETTPYTRIVGRKIEPINYGLPFSQVKGEVKLRHHPRGYEYRLSSTILEHGEFNNRLERQFLMKVWAAKYLIHLSPHLYSWAIILNETE